jgi:hypothetical protein
MTTHKWGARTSNFPESRITPNSSRQIVELRGPLGPNDASVCGVQVSRKPVATFIELLQNQLENLDPSRVGADACLPESQTENIYSQVPAPLLLPPSLRSIGRVARPPSVI